MSDKINVTIPLEGNSKWEKEYSKSEKIQKIIEDFQQETNKEIAKDIFMNWKYNDKLINLNDPISIFILDNNTSNINLDFGFGNDFDINNTNFNDCELIGKPLSKPFQIQIYDKKNNEIKCLNVNQNEIDKYQMEKYGNESGYCNGNNHLYILGGEYKNNILNDFWDIDLKKIQIEKIPNVIKKKNHSMTFILNKYVFIVGGNSKNTFYYDTETKIIKEWADLNYERNEPALIEINNELYCFDNLKKGNNDITFEKTNLNLKENPKWEIIKPNLNDNFLQKFFGCSKLDDDTILFIGGFMIKDNSVKSLMNFKYNVPNNVISVSDIPFENMDLSEKNSYKIDNQNDIIIPNYKKEEPKVIIIEKDNKTLKQIKFKLNEPIKDRISDLKRLKRAKMKSYNFDMPYMKDFDKKGISQMDLKKLQMTEENEKPSYRTEDKSYNSRNKYVNLKTNFFSGENEDSTNRLDSNNENIPTENRIDKLIKNEPDKIINKDSDRKIEKIIEKDSENEIENKKIMEKENDSENQFEINTDNKNKKKLNDKKSDDKPINNNNLNIDKKFDDNPLNDKKSENKISEDKKSENNLEKNPIINKNVNNLVSELESEVENKLESKFDSKFESKIENSNINENELENENLLSKNTMRKSIKSKPYSESTFSGGLIRNSVIINNNEGKTKISKIPKISKKYRRFNCDKVVGQGDFNINGVRGLTQSVNIGIGGKK